MPFGGPNPASPAVAPYQHPSIGVGAAPNMGPAPPVHGVGPGGPMIHPGGGVGGPERSIEPPPGGGIGRIPTQPIRSHVLGSFKKGGHVKKTGVYKLHKGEHVVPHRKL